MKGLLDRGLGLAVLAAMLVAGAAWAPGAPEYANAVGPISNGTHELGPSPGYTLIAPMRSTTTYLVDMAGRRVHSWESEYPPGLSAYLLENGHLLRTARADGRSLLPQGTHVGGWTVGSRLRDDADSTPSFSGAASGGRVQEFT
jgi:hypothetical protein